jgi:hypothetical protein
MILSYQILHPASTMAETPDDDEGSPPKNQ